MYKKNVKHILDFAIALIGLLLILPIFLVVMIALAIANSGNPFFTQPRPGMNEKIFYVIKFKTMNDNRGVDGKLLNDSERLTRIGTFVRKTSLDEIPQLINVLKGDMSLIGPRPLLIEYLPLYNPEQRKRHLIKPGITGWAQVNGRNTISWDEKFKLDVYYVNNCSAYLDGKIIFWTVKKVFLSHGITAPGMATMSKFKGRE